MISSNIHIALLLPGLISAFLLLIFPITNYIIKAALTAFVTILLGYISIILFGWNTVYLVSDTHGGIFLISVIAGVPLSIFSGLAIIAIFIKQNKKY